MRVEIRKALKEGRAVDVDCGSGFRRFLPGDGPVHEITEEVIGCAMRAPYCGNDPEDEGPADWQDRIVA